MFDNYEYDVFINCPFDDKYKPIFSAIIFTIYDCGFNARCSLEVDDSSETRIDKIQRIIEGCKYSIHDISRTELDKDSKLPRFNMPLELGLFLGAKRFGDNLQKKKSCLILDKDKYRFQQYISDISGQDIQSHKNNVNESIKCTRNWLNNKTTKMRLPGGFVIVKRYAEFKKALPKLCDFLELEFSELIFDDFTNLVSEWLKINAS